MVISVSSFTIKEPAGLAEDWRLYQVGPTGPEGRYSHQYLLPEVLEEPQQFLGDGFTPLSHFRPKTASGELPFFEVAATRWPWDVSLRDFFELVTAQHGLKPKKIRHVDLLGLNVLDGEFHARPDLPPNMARVMVFKNHNLLWRVWGVGSAADFEQGLNNLFHVAVESFTLQTQGDDMNIGVPVEVKTPFGLHFMRPEGWREALLPPGTPDTEAIDLKLDDANSGEVLAYHRVKLITGQRLDQETTDGLAESALEEWSDAGLSGAKLADKQTVQEPRPHTAFKTKGNINQNPVALWVSVLPLQSGTAVLSTLAPSRDHNAPVWMAARRAHAMCLETLNTL